VTPRPRASLTVACWSAVTVELAVLLTAVPGLIQLAVDSGSIEVRKRSIGSVGLRVIDEAQSACEYRRGSGRRCHLYLDEIVTSLVRRVTLPTVSPFSLPVKLNVSALTRWAYRLRQSSTWRRRGSHLSDRDRRKS
jgi:hypothetical protein